MEHNRVIYSKAYDSEVEYLESTRTQWIDTGILNTYGTSVEVDFQIINTGATGVQYDILRRNTGIFIKFTANSGKIEVNNGHHNNRSIKDNVYERKKIFIDSTSKTFSVNEIESTFSDEPTKFSHDYTLCLFSNGGLRGAAVKIYTAKFWDNGILVRDFIPVRVGSVGYLYDKVSKKLFVNKGTGNFILGNDVANPVPNIRRVFKFDNKRFVMPMLYDSKVEYLKSNGNQYLDIGIIPKSGYRAICVYMPETISGTTEVYALFGQRTNSYSSNMFSVFMSFGTSRQIYAQYAGNKSALIVDNAPNILHTIELGKNSYLDGNLLKTVTETFNGAYTISIFAIHQNYSGSVNYSDRHMKDCRVYSFKLYNDLDTLIFDGIPVRKGNEGYIYDRVSGKLFGNKGTGDFIFGNDIND